MYVYKGDVLHQCATGGAAIVANVHASFLHNAYAPCAQDNPAIFTVDTILLIW